MPRKNNTPAETQIHSIVAPNDNTKLHVVFVHGLDGHPIKTWETNGVFWPEWLMESAPNFAIWSIGYPASKTRWRGGRAMHIIDRGKSIYHALKPQQQLDIGNICFIGHSMGGLLIKQLLVEAMSQSLTDANVNDFLGRVTKVAFIGTPHAGAILASVSKLIPNFARPTPATYSMGVDDPNLRDLDNRYKNLAQSLNIQHLILFETQKLAPIKWFPALKVLVVSPSSATPMIDGDIIPIDADHENICKPNSKDSQAYIQLNHFLTSEAFENKDKIRLSAKLDELADGNLEIIEKLSQIGTGHQITNSGLFDKEIKTRLNRIRHNRFFGAFDAQKDSQELLDSVTNGELSSGTQTIRASTISWCVRILSASTDIEKLNGYMEHAKKLAPPCEEFEIAQFFIDSKSQAPLKCAISDFINSESELKRDAAAILYIQLHGSNNAIEWIKGSQMSFSQFSAEGLVRLFQVAVDAERWDFLDELREFASVGPIESSPALLSWVGISFLTHAVLNTHHKKLVTQPIYFGNIPFAGDESSKAYRKQAIELFRQSATLACELKLIGVSEYQEEFALWLELQDEDLKGPAVKEILSKMKGAAEQVVRFFPLAVHFLNEGTNFTAIESAIDAQTRKTLGESFHANLSRCSYLFFLCKGNPPEIVLDYLTKHRSQVLKVLSEENVLTLEIEFLIGNGKIESAEEKITEFKNKYSISEKIKQCENMLLEAQGADGIKLLTEQYRDSGDLSDLNILTMTLEKNGEFALLEKYSADLFTRTKTTKSAELHLRALGKNENFEGISIFFENHSEMINSSSKIKYDWSWNLFRLGAIKQSLAVVEELSKQVKINEFIYLKTNCLIAVGDWAGISKLVEEAWNNKNEINSSLLMWLANLAALVLPNRAKDIVHFVAEREQLDPDVQLAAYSMAVNMGWEESDKPREWITNALQQSSEAGPVKSVPFEELIERSHEWRDREDQILKLFNDMQTPSLMVAKSLNRTLTSFYLSPAILNKFENDLRFQQPIPAFTSYRPSLNNVPKVLAFDTTSLLTLGFLKQLDLTIRFAEKIYIPHSFMIWLFEELKETSFHQPSRVKRAKALSELISDGRIKILRQDVPKSIDLGLYIGNELAVLFEVSESTASKPSYVVRSLPVHVAGSYTMEKADLGDNANRILECCNIVDSLQINGHISEQEGDKARDFLNNHEQMKSLGFIVEANAELLFDDLSITYFQDMDLLEQLVNSEFSISIHRQTVEHTNGLIRLESQFSKVNEHLEYIQKCLADGISKGVIQLSRMSKNNQDDRLRVLADLFALDQEVQGVVVDDRFINQHPNFEIDGKVIPSYTTLDLMTTFHYSNEVDIAEHCSLLANLRQAQYHLIPVTSDEIMFWLKNPNILDGRLIEGFGLKVLRRYLNKLKTSNSIQLPRDADWLLNTLKSISNSLKSTWFTELTLNEKIAISNWLYDISDYRDWAPFHQSQAGENLGNNGKLISVHTLLIHSHDDGKLSEDYSKWLAEYVLEPLKYEEPAIYQMLLDQCKAEIKRQMGDENLWKDVDVEQLR